jgi:uncharacterized membrane protein YoaK (UPF0700 family)
VMMGTPMEPGPPASPAPLPSHRRHRVLVALLAGTSGALDALGFLALGGVFASVMTGNLVLLGLGAGTRDGGLAWHALVAIGAYVVGVALGTRAAGHRAGADPARWSLRLHRLVAGELVLVVAFTLGWELVRHRSAVPAQLALVAVAASAMGVQSAVMRASTANTLSTTYLTGTLTGVVAALAGGGPVRRELDGASVLLAALAGAGVAGVVLTGWASWAPLVPLCTLVGALVAGRTLTRPPGSDAPVA